MCENDWFISYMNQGSKKLKFLEYLSKTLNIKLKEVYSKRKIYLESLNEYNFSIYKFLGRTINNEKVEIYIRIIPKGKIKESIFCFYALLCEEYLKNNIQKDKLKLPQKIAILQEKENIEYNNKIYINLYNDVFKKEKSNYNIEINFVKIEDFLKQNKDIIKSKRWEKYVSKDSILLIGKK